MAAKKARKKGSKTVVEISPYEAARRRLLPNEDAPRSSLYLKLEMGGEKVPAFVLEPTFADKQVYIALIQPPSAKKEKDGTITTSGKGNYTAAKIALMIRCLYFAPDGEDGPVGGRLFKDDELGALIGLPASVGWINEASDHAEKFMEEGVEQAEKK